MALSETEQRAACSGHGDGSGQMPRVPIGKGRLGVCLVRAHDIKLTKEAEKAHRDLAQALLDAEKNAR